MDQFKGTFSVLIPLPKLAQSNRELCGNVIKPEDFLNDPAVNGGENVELDPHITVQMGLKDDVKLLQSICKNVAPFSIEITDLGSFVTKRLLDDDKDHYYDVLWREVVDSHGRLSNFHDKITKQFDRAWHFAAYKPHATVAFLNYESSKEYIKMPGLTVVTEYVDHVLFKKFGSSKEPDPKPVPIKIPLLGMIKE